MSLDLSWDLLDEGFTAGLVEKLNRVLDTTKRPDYLGPITLSNLTLGSEAPDVSIVDVGDVWPGFMEQDEAARAAAAAEQAVDRGLRQAGPSQLQTKRWPQTGQGRRRGSSQAARNDSRLSRFADRNLPFAGIPPGAETPLDGSRDGPDFYGDDALGLPEAVERASRHARKRDAQRFQSYRQYSDSGRMHRIETGSMVSGYNTGSVTPWSAATPGLGWVPSSQAQGYFSAWPGAPPLSSADQSMESYAHISPQFSRAQSWQRQSSQSPAPQLHQTPRRLRSNSFATGEDGDRSHFGAPYDESPAGETAEQSSSLPSLQLQLSLSWATQSLRLTLQTSLLINHPSPAFMSLPLTITITGIALQAGGLLAFEVDQISKTRRAHFCLTVEDDAVRSGDAASPLTDAPQKQAAADITAGGLGLQAGAPIARDTAAAGGLGGQWSGAARGLYGAENNAASTPGEQILYGVTLETSVGQAHKHVLKNVAKVERFVVTLARKAINDELVFPNFYSIELSS